MTSIKCVFKLIIQTLLRKARGWFCGDVHGKTWVIAGEIAVIAASSAFANLILEPLFSYYSESSYLGEYLSELTLGILIGYFGLRLFVPKFREGAKKRYVIIIKILLMPIIGLIIILLNNKTFYRETVHDLPRGGNKNE